VIHIYERINYSNQLIEDIKKSKYDDIVDNLLNLLKFQIRRDYIDKNEKVDELIQKTKNFIEIIIEKIIRNFGHTPKIIKYCINTSFTKGEEFTSKDLDEKIKEKFYIHIKGLSKYLNNEFDKKINPYIKKVERGKYCILI